MNVAAIVIATLAFIVAVMNGRKLMDQLDRIETLISDLNAAVTAETAQQKTLVDQLRALADDRHGSTDPNRLTKIADDLEASIARVKAIVPDTTDDGGDDSTDAGETGTQPSADEPPTSTPAAGTDGTAQSNG
jgi:uncharacterized protein YoxC